MVQDGAGGGQVPRQVAAARDGFAAGRDIVFGAPPARASLAVTVVVRDADPRRLGVHAAITVPGIADGRLPEYVLRDVDAGQSGVRARVKAAAGRGGFVLLVGAPSAGKTRCAFEAVTAVLPGWQLVHPGGPGEIAELAAAPPPQTVVWLDELQRYLGGEDGLTGGAVRALLGAAGPVVIIGTLWPERLAAYTALPASGSADPRAREREVLGLADVVRIAAEFSPDEQDRARTAAATDRQLAAALNTAGYGLTQTLAAAPQLAGRWEDARTAAPYAWAVLAAALDAARLGARAPLSSSFLQAAAPGYCTSRQQAEAPDNWFEQALAYATEKLHGAAAALAPAGAGMGRTDGYTAADYLVQRASRERRYARLPASAWDAILSHVRDPADIERLADSARDRLLYRCAIPLYRRATESGAGSATAAAINLADLLARQGDLDTAMQLLRGLADSGDEGAAEQLTDLLARRPDLDRLRAEADAGNKHAARQLTDLLARQGNLDELRALADAGNDGAAWNLANLLAEADDLDGLRALADAGIPTVGIKLAELLARRGRGEEAERLRMFGLNADGSIADA